MTGRLWRGGDCRQGGLALGGVGTQESGESTWLRGGDVESLAGGAQESGESPWFGGGLDGVNQGSPRVAISLSV